MSDENADHVLVVCNHVALLQGWGQVWSYVTRCDMRVLRNAGYITWLWFCQGCLYKEVIQRSRVTLQTIDAIYYHYGALVYGHSLKRTIFSLCFIGLCLYVCANRSVQVCAYRSVPIGLCLQVCAYRSVPIGLCLLVCAYRSVPIGLCLQVCAYRSVPIGLCPQVCAYRSVPIGLCPQVCAHRSVPIDLCLQAL